jgi:hypothetical protein
MFENLTIAERVTEAEEKTRRVVDHLLYVLELHENNAIVWLVVSNIALQLVRILGKSGLGEVAFGNALVGGRGSPTIPGVKQPVEDILVLVGSKPVLQILKGAASQRKPDEAAVASNQNIIRDWSSSGGVGHLQHQDTVDDAWRQASRSRRTAIVRQVRCQP